MKISTKSKNAVAILSFLACFEQGSVISMDKIEDKLKLSASYSAQILADLKNDGMVESKMGIGGGYFIPKTAQLEEITIGDVCRAVEKDMYVVECVFDTSKCELKKDAYLCKARNTMCDISDIIFDALDGIYITDVAKMLCDNGFADESEYTVGEVMKSEDVGKKQIWNAWLD